MPDVLHDERFPEEGLLKLVLGVEGPAHRIDLVTQKLGEVHLALAEVRREDQNPASCEDTAQLAEHVADSSSRQMLKRVEHDGARARPGPNGQGAHVGAHERKAGRPAPGGGEHPGSEVHTDDRETPTPEVHGDLGRATADVENRSPAAEASYASVEHSAINGQSTKVVGERHRIVLRDLVISSPNGRGMERFHDRQSAGRGWKRDRLR